MPIPKKSSKPPEREPLSPQRTPKKVKQKESK